MTFTILALAGLTLAAHPDSSTDAVSREQFTELIRSLYADLHDVEYRYEGESRRLKEPDYSKMPEPLRKASEREAGRRKGHVHQGTWAFRDDMSIYQEIYKKPLDVREPLVRETRCLLKWKAFRRIFIPDQGGLARPDNTEPGHLGSVTCESSPLLVFGHAFLLEMVTTTNSMDYRFVKWEKLDGRRCLVVEFFMIDPSTGKDGWMHRFWIDLERGGHTLRIEKYDAGTLQAVVTDVALAQFATDGKKTVWYPIRGRQETYQDGAGFYQSPSYVQTFDVLGGTMKFNQNLPDARFTLDWGLDKNTLSQVKKLTPDAKNAQKGTRSKSVEEQIKSAIVSADAQSKALEASSPSRNSWLSRNAVPLSLGAGGIVVFIAAAVLKKQYS